jgi:hypothetical protein
LFDDDVVQTCIYAGDGGFGRAKMGKADQGGPARALIIFKLLDEFNKIDIWEI